MPEVDTVGWILVSVTPHEGPHTAEGHTELCAELLVCLWSSAELELEVQVKRRGDGEVLSFFHFLLNEWN